MHYVLVGLNFSHLKPACHVVHFIRRHKAIPTAVTSNTEIFSNVTKQWEPKLSPTIHRTVACTTWPDEVTSPFLSSSLMSDSIFVNNLSCANYLKSLSGHRSKSWKLSILERLNGLKLASVNTYYCFFFDDPGEFTTSNVSWYKISFKLIPGSINRSLDLKTDPSQTSVNTLVEAALFCDITCFYLEEAYTVRSTPSYSHLCQDK